MFSALFAALFVLVPVCLAALIWSANALARRILAIRVRRERRSGGWRVRDVARPPSGRIFTRP